MKNKPESQSHRSYSAGSNDDLNDSSSEMENMEAETPDFENGSAVGVDNSYGSYTSMFERTHVDDTFDEDDPYEYQLFGMDDEYATLPRPEVFAAYPPEVQRKILEWTDRDFRARREDESRRRDEMMRARMSRDNTRIAIPVAIVILGILCAAITGVMTKNAFIVVAFLIIPLAIVIAAIVRFASGGMGGHRHSL